MALPRSSTSLKVLLPAILREFNLGQISYELSGATAGTAGTATVDRTNWSITVPLPTGMFTDPSWAPKDPGQEGAVAFYALDLAGVGPSNAAGGADDANRFSTFLALHPTAASGAEQARTDLRALDYQAVRYQEFREVPAARAVDFGDTVTVAGPAGFWRTVPSRTSPDRPGVRAEVSSMYWGAPVTVSSDGSALSALVQSETDPEPLFPREPGPAQVWTYKEYGPEGWNLSNTVVPIYIGPPAAPTIKNAIPGNGQVTVRWTPLDVDAAVTKYRIRAYNGSTLVKTTTAAATATSTVMTGLTNGIVNGYTFDVSGINAAGTGTPTARSAMVTPRTEFVLPAVTARAPAGNARAVPPSSSVSVAFSEPVNRVSSSTVVLRTGTTTVPATVSYDAVHRRATLRPNSTLRADTTYTVSVSRVRDSAGNAIVATSWSFRTGPPPTVGSTFPGRNETGVRRNADVSAGFSEPITGYSTTTARITRVSDGTQVIADVSYDAATRVLTIDPRSSLAANTRYAVHLTGGISGIRDAAGNPITAKSWTFTTGAVL